MNKFLVIARYMEDIGWIDQLANIENLSIAIIQKDLNHNIGRESLSYIQYIIDNYNNINENDSYIFCQGNPFDHCRDFISLISIHSKLLEFLNLSDHKLRCDKNGLPNHKLPISDVWSQIMETPLPDQIDFGTGAQFIVSGKNILSKPIDFYKKCKQIHILIESSPWVFERIWHLIFSVEHRLRTYFFGANIGDAIISINNIKALGDESNFDIECFPNTKIVTSDDIKTIIVKNIHNLNSVNVSNSQREYEMYAYNCHDYFSCKKASWEKLIRAVSVISGKSTKDLWPVHPRYGYINKRCKIFNPNYFFENNSKDLNIYSGEYILYNPISVASEVLSSHNKIRQFIFRFLLNNSKYKIVLTAKDKIEFTHQNLINLSGLTKSALDLWSLADQSAFTITTSNNLSHYCYYNKLPCFTLLNESCSNPSFYFRQFIDCDTNHSINHDSDMGHFMSRFGEFLHKNKLEFF